MPQFSIGDMAQAFILRGRNHGLKTTIGDLTQEVASGQVADPVVRLGGHLSYLSQIERDRYLADTYSVSVKEVMISASAMQSALENVGNAATGLVEALSLSTGTIGDTYLSLLSTNARGQLDSIIASLNTNVAGRQLFSGVDVEVPPLASAGILLSELRTALAGATSQADVIAAADVFFDTPGGGFETLIYQGGEASLAPVDLGSGESANLDIRADDPVMRDMLKTVSLAALADDPGLSLSAASRKALSVSLLGDLLEAKDGVVLLRADLGVAEEQIERASTRIEAESAALQMARNTLLEADPFEAATELEAARLQLETLYTVTARTSRLSLVNFLS
jgi:flagellar hook-associated protein 3 FlgL